MTTLNPDDGHMILINTFTVDPDKADDLLAELIHASGAIVSGDWGCISANLHISEDRKHVANYAQWRSHAHYAAFLADPATKAHLGKAAGLAQSFDPIIYSLRATENAEAEAERLTAWIGVASLEHVRKAERGGFFQANHGKEAPVKRLQRGDRVIFYSPREGMRSGALLRSFTAIGDVVDVEPHRVRQTSEFEPFRRKVDYLHADPAAIGPLLARLSFSAKDRNWGLMMRRGFFSISDGDAALIADAMNARPSERTG